MSWGWADGLVLSLQQVTSEHWAQSPAGAFSRLSLTFNLVVNSKIESQLLDCFVHVLSPYRRHGPSWVCLETIIANVSIIACVVSVSPEGAKVKCRMTAKDRHLTA